MKDVVAQRRWAAGQRRGSARAASRLSSIVALRWPLLAIVAAGVLLRLWLIAVSPLDPRFSNADDGDFYRRALRLAVTGEYIDDSWLIRPPLHVFFFALWLKVALVLGRPEAGVLLVQLAQTAVAMLTILTGHALARRLFRSERAGLLFGGFLALWFPFVEQPTVLFSELLYLFFFLVHVWLLLRFDRGEKKDVGGPGPPTPPPSRGEEKAVGGPGAPAPRPSGGAAGAPTQAQSGWGSRGIYSLALSGAALGLAALTRSPALYSLAFVAVWLAVRAWAARRRQGGSSGRWRAVARQWLAVAACCLAVVLPWTARNYLVYGRLIPVDTLGQVNLWLDLDRVADRNRNIETLRGMPQADRAGYALAQARDILAEDPWRLFESMWPTFQHIWKAQYVEDFFVKQSFFTRPLRETAWLGLAGDLLWLVFTLAGVAGLAGPLREGLHNRLFTLAWLGYSLATVLIFHVEPRYLLPIWTLLALYGAGFLASLGRPAADDRRPRSGMMSRWSIVQIGLALTCIGLIVTYRDYPRIIASGIARERGIVAGEAAYRAGDYAAAEQGFRQALAAQPGFVDAEVSLALALAAQGRYDEAAATIRRDSSRRAELAYGAIARDVGDIETARGILTRYESIAGEDVQRWALEWLRPPPTQALAIGDGLDLGYIQGFLEAEQGVSGPYRWLAGSGRVVLPLPEPLAPGATVALRLAGGRPGATPLTVRVGDGPAWRVPVEGGQWRSYRIAVPPELAGRRTLTLTLSAPTFVPALLDPRSGDARALSLMVGGVEVR